MKSQERITTKARKIPLSAMNELKALDAMPIIDDNSFLSLYLCFIFRVRLLDATYYIIIECALYATRESYVMDLKSDIELFVEISSLRSIILAKIWRRFKNVYDNTKIVITP